MPEQIILVVHHTQDDIEKGGERPGAKVGIAVEREIDHPARHVVSVRDPDGLLLQFFVNKDWTAKTLAGLGAEDALYLL